MTKVLPVIIAVILLFGITGCSGTDKASVPTVQRENTGVIEKAAEEFKSIKEKPAEKPVEKPDIKVEEKSEIPEEPEEPNKKTEDKKLDTTVNEEDGAETPQETTAGQEENSEEGLANTGFKLMDRETVGGLKRGMTDKSVVSLLGEAQEKTEILVWGADGLKHQTWKYEAKGIELDLTGEQGSQKVNMIHIRRPCELKTSRDIGIGSKKEDVEKKYRSEIGKEYSNETAIVAGTVYGGIIFEIKDGLVESIFIGAAAE